MLSLYNTKQQLIPGGIKNKTENETDNETAEKTPNSP